MTKSEEELIRKMKSLFMAPAGIEPATVKSVDLVKLTCVVQLLNETEVVDVRLKALIDNITDGMVQIPTVESVVLVGMIGNDVSTRCVFMVSAVEEVVFYNGGNDGLVKVVPLVAKLNALEQKVNDLISKFNGHVHPGVSTGGGSSAATLTTVAGSLNETQKADLENVKVKH